MRTIAVVNQKGGSGKTTTAVNLAAALAERKQKVLLIDLDPQANATAWLGIHDAGRGLFDVFSGNKHITDIVRITSINNLSVVPSSSWLAGVEKGAEGVLRNQLEGISGWDYILIDCPPTLGVLTVSALVAVREVLVPVEARVMALSGLAGLLETVEVVKERLNRNLYISGILACSADLRTRLAGEVIDDLRKRFGRQVYRTVIRQNVRIAEAYSFEQPITVYDTTSAGAEDYRALASEVLKQERSGNGN